MYKVLIAEDEVIVREWLRSYVDWQKYDMTVCGVASNGQEAFDVYEQEKRTRFLILTCLDEFACNIYSFITKRVFR